MTQSIYAISDLHLSLDNSKPMDVFGDDWVNHHEKIRESWLEHITDNDIVLLAGDTSWAMKLERAVNDLSWVDELPGQKVLIKGNHDYWWTSLKKMNDLHLESLHFIQNNSILLNGVAVAGCRLWDFPFISWPQEFKDFKVDGMKTEHEQNSDTEQDEKIRVREMNRLEMSLKSIPKDAEKKIVLLHYPPVSSTPEGNQITDLISQFDIDLVVYGHLHCLGKSERAGADCVIGNTRYVLSACDWLDFKILKVF